MKFITNYKIIGLTCAGLYVFLLSGCANQSQQSDAIEAQLNASVQALQDCQARLTAAEEHAQRSEFRAEELRLRADELARRMSRMEARMTSKG